MVEVSHIATIWQMLNNLRAPTPHIRIGAGSPADGTRRCCWPGRTCGLHVVTSLSYWFRNCGQEKSSVRKGSGERGEGSDEVCQCQHRPALYGVSLLSNPHGPLPCASDNENVYVARGSAGECERGMAEASHRMRHLTVRCHVPF